MRYRTMLALLFSAVLGMPACSSSSSGGTPDAGGSSAGGSSTGGSAGTSTGGTAGTAGTGGEQDGGIDASGGSTGDAAQAATLTITPADTTLNAAQNPVVLDADLENSTDTISWTLSPAVGTLSADSGPQVVYTPPGTLDSATTVTVSASAAGLSAHATITVNPPPALATGTPLPNKRFVALDKVVEYEVLGLDYDGSGNNQFIVDPYHAYYWIDSLGQQIPQGDTYSTTAILDKQANTSLVSSRLKVARAGQLDDDYPEETVVLSWDPTTSAPASIAMLDPSPVPGGNPKFGMVPINVDLSVVAGGSTHYDYDLALDDVDGDGYDEIVVVGTVTDPTVSKPGKLWVIDDATNNFAVLHTVDLQGDFDTTLGYRGLMKAKVAAGDLAHDGTSQLVVAWYDSTDFNTNNVPVGSDPNTLKGLGAISWAVYDGADCTQIGSNHATSLLPGSTTDYLSNRRSLPQVNNDNAFDMTLADVDGNGTKEVAFAAYDTYYDVTTAKYGARILTDVYTNPLTSPARLSTAAPTLSFGPGNFSAAEIQAGPPRHFLLASKRHGGPVDYLYAGPTALAYTGSDTLTEDGFVWDTVDKNFNYLTAGIADTQSGDVNCDDKDDFIILYNTGKVEARGLLSQFDHYDPQHNPVYTSSPAWTVLDTSDGGQIAATGNAVLVAANVDSDSTMVEYNDVKTNSLHWKDATPAHSIFYSDNKLIALLAAPPTKDGIDQNNSSSYTEYGSASSGGQTSSAEVSTSASLIVGFEQGLSVFGVEIAKVEGEFTYTVDATATFSSTTETTQTITYQGAPGEDTVVFSTTPYDRYWYTVASSPNPQVVNTQVQVDVPRKPAILSVTRDYFNTHNLDGIQITKDLLPDTPYDLTTYPAGTAGADAILAKTSADIGGLSLPSAAVQFGRMGPYVVTEGNGGKGASIDISQESAWSAGATYSVDATLKLTIGGFTIGGGLGFAAGGTQENWMSNANTFGGFVGSIPDTYYASNQYSWGIFAYKQTITTTDGKPFQDFFVINYWIE